MSIKKDLIVFILLPEDWISPKFSESPTRTHSTRRILKLTKLTLQKNILFNLNPNKITLFKPYLPPSGNVGGYCRGQLDNMYRQVEPSCTVGRLDLWVVRFDLYSGKAAMDALLGHDHLSMRQKSHTLDRAASPSPLLIFWNSYNDCIINDSVGQRVQIVSCVSILFWIPGLLVMLAPSPQSFDIAYIVDMCRTKVFKSARQVSY